MSVQIVLLNGASSSGKSTIAAELHDLLPGAWLRLSIDSFLEMLPLRLRGAVNPAPSDSRAEGTWYDMPLSEEETRQVEAIRSEVIAGRMTARQALERLGVADRLAAAGVRIRCGAHGRRLISGMHRSLAALAGAGNRLIVDHVFWERDWLTECAVCLAPYDVLLVGIHCPLALLAERERARGDRVMGQARADAERVHWEGVYDLEIDTSACSPSVAAVRNAECVGADEAPAALRRLAAASAG